MTNHTLLLAQASLSGLGTVAMVTVGLVVVVVIFAAIWASRYIKVGPNEVLVVSGRKHRYTDPDGTVQTRGFRVRKGGGTFVIPVIEKVDRLSLELLTIDVQQEQDVYTSKGVPVRVDGVAQIKVKGDDISIATAAEQFLSKDTEAIKNIAMQTLEGHLRAILGTMTVEDIYQNRDAFAQKVQEVAAGDMANMGLGIVSFTIRDIKDSQGYLDALGKPRIAQVKRDAQIAQAEADRDAMIKSSQAIQAGQEAKFEADTRIAEAQRDYQSNVAQYQAAVNQKKAEAAGAASATKATGFAAADVVKATGIAEADANKARGLAQAAVIEAQGKATAEAMRVKAESFKQYNEAAVVEMIIRVLPEVAGKISEPLSKTEKMIIINSGSGVGGGASKLTGDVTQIMAQLPPIIESLTGIKFEKLLEQVPGLKQSMGKSEGEDKKS